MSFSFLLSAQVHPPFLPEDVASQNLSSHEFSKPGILNKSRGRGIELSFLNVGGSELVREDSSSITEGEIKNIQKIEFKVKIPLIIRKELRVLLGYSYRPEKYQFSSYGDHHAPVFQHLDGLMLKSQQATVFVNKSIRARGYLTFMARVAFNGDYEKFFNLDNQYRVFTSTAMYGIKRNENTEMGFGLIFSSSFRRTIALPIFMFNHNFNSKFGVELGLPAVALGRWNVNKSTIVLCGMEYNSKSFAIHVPVNGTVQNFGMNHSEIRFPICLEKQFHRWFWLGAQVGYQYSFSTDFDANNDAAFQTEPKPAPYFNVGIFLSPPDEVLEK